MYLILKLNPMKKTTLLTFAFIAITFASCKKDRVCTCEDQEGDVTETTYFDSSKSDAQTFCSSRNTKTKYIPVTGSTGYVSEVNCELE